MTDDFLPSTESDLLPPNRPPGGASRGLSRRALLIAAGAVAGVVILIVGILVVGGGDSKKASVLGSTARKSTTSTSRGRRSTSSSDSSTTSTSTTSADAGSTATTDPSSGTPPDTATPGAPEAKITMRQNAGSCKFDAATGDLLVSGTITNNNPDGHRVLISATWFADDGSELNGAADQWYVDAGGEPLDWDLSNGWDETPAGLRCEVTFEVIE